MEWHWSGIGVRRKYEINTPKTLRSGIGVYCESGIGVVVMEYALWSSIGVYCESGIGVVVMECALQSGIGV